MRWDARTPEELDTLLEDAFVMRDREALRGLFARDAVLAAHAEAPAAHGHGEIARAVTAMWTGERLYLAGTRRVLRRGALALVASEGATHVVLRGPGRSWRFAISLLSPDDTRMEEWR